MVKLAVFDLDNTLAKIGKGISYGDIELLRELEQKGVRIAICSGKPAYYLCGFLRQVELREPILIGENGATLQFGVDLPPRESRILPHSDQAKRTIAFLKTVFDAALPDLWYQPNQVGLTPFPAKSEEFDEIEVLLHKHSSEIRDVTIYRHIDSFDIIPNGINKYAGVAYLGELLGISREETVAVGDGVNDYPMFDYAGHAVGVRVADESKVDRNFESITEALEYLLKIV